MYPLPILLAAEPFARLPDAFRTRTASAWGDVNLPGHAHSSFLEGPSFDREGNLYVVDIAFGRIFRITPGGEWSLVAEYDGWPNGLKVHPDGRLFVADYKRGILQVDPQNGQVTPFLERHRSEGFKGCNDLFFGSAGELYFTDQGQTGLHDATGRVYRWSEQRGLELLISTVPSPNGLVMNLAGTQLYIGVTRGNAVWRLPLMPDGGVSKAGLFVQLSGGAAGPDGLALDDEGGLWVCHPGMGVWRFDLRGRPTHLIEAEPGSLWTNLAFGGDGGRSLFITESATGVVLRADTPFAGRAMASHAA
ncbi:MAG: SMP-30/gluconolactonase/LRE family protein [Phenylobacterium sp.]|uniref:SMP-30/gluconolactonase/LRE family protein n=1 Tax=Phenylobacterium sp. TaxID=1871053 RepID=UPI0027349962|nr:SMP-30/gluconolactonase/LRE family protein [Phenylobacterium sp.]MDP3173063.1 SMP-30/gluconolactonase/LRE family protein [Phenylobacterium sp.]